MKVYYAWNGAGTQAILANEELAKEWLKRSINKGNEDDPDPWEGWVWWQNKRNDLCFGGNLASNPGQVAEGYIREYELLTELPND
jgi:hypothetical protein